MSISLNAGCGSGGDSRDATNAGATNVGARIPSVTQTPDADSPQNPTTPRPRPTGNGDQTAPNPPEPEEQGLRGERFVTGGRFVSQTANYSLTVAVSEPFPVVDADHIETNYQLRSTLSFER